MKSKNWMVSALLAALLVCSALPAGSAQAADIPEPPQVISDGGDGLFVFWEQGEQVRGQHLDGEGQLLWPKGGLRFTGEGSRAYSLSAMPDGSGGALLAWQGVESGQQVLRTQRVSADGSLVWGQGGIMLAAGPGGLLPGGIVSDGSGGALLTWGVSEGRFQDRFQRLSAQRLDARGRPAWTPPEGVLLAQGENIDRAALASDGAGGLYCAWRDHGEQASGFYLQRFDAGGRPAWEKPYELGQEGGSDWELVLAEDGAGGVLVGRRNGTAGILRLQRLSAQGEPLWSGEGLHLAPVEAPEVPLPSVVSDRQGEALVAWAGGSYAELGGKLGVFAQKFDPFGKPLWGAQPLFVLSGEGKRLDVSLAAARDGGVFVAWRAGYRQGDGVVSVQRLDARGDLLWGQDGLRPFPDDLFAAQGFPLVLSERDGGALVVARAGYTSGLQNLIYAQRLDAKGAPLWGSEGVQVASLWPSPGDVIGFFKRAGHWLRSLF